jgi:dTDP-4-dehydrorhamnose reductase
MKQKVLIVGSKGMAGHVIYFMLKQAGIAVEDVSRSNDYFPSTYVADAADAQAMKSIIANGRFNAIVNCVGALNQDAERNPDKAILVNAWLPHFLAQEAVETGCRLIHISTDCVFSGDTGGYTEESVKDGRGFYATSKALGEVVYAPHITIRTSIIGPELKQNGIGLLHWYLKASGDIKGYTAAWWTGVTTTELARCVMHLLDRPELTGLIHAVPRNKICKFDLLRAFEHHIGNKHVTHIEPFDGYSVDKSLISTRGDTGYQAPDYGEMLEALKLWIQHHPELYSQYLHHNQP